MVSLQTLEALAWMPESAYEPMPDVVMLDDRHEFVKALCATQALSYQEVERICEFRRWVRIECEHHAFLAWYGPGGG